jgi:hypothetical protein
MNPMNLAMNKVLRACSVPGKGRGARERGRRRRFAAFTLAEVLAALAFMAIVIPVAIEGLRVANLAGVVALRKAVAVRIADRVLNEKLLGDQASARSGIAQEGVSEYRWSIRYTPWPEDAMQLVTVQVLFAVQGRDYDVNLSTLVSSSK